MKRKTEKSPAPVQTRWEMDSVRIARILFDNPRIYGSEKILRKNLAPVLEWMAENTDPKEHAPLIRYAIEQSKKGQKNARFVLLSAKWFVDARKIVLQTLHQKHSCPFGLDEDGIPKPFEQRSVPGLYTP